jgi:hypothetical protein
MWPLQQTSRMEEFEPPMGMAQEERVVGGEGIWEGVEQDILIFGEVSFVGEVAACM